MRIAKLNAVAPPLIVVLLAWLLRCWHLNFYDFRGDEVFGIFYVEAPLSQVIGTLAQGEPHPPLFYLLLHYWIPIVGDGEYALRWLSAAGGALGVALLYVFGRRIGGALVGMVAALILCLSAYHIWNAQDARMYTLATALVTAAVYWSWRLLTDERPSRRAALGYSIAMLLALYTHYYSVYITVLLNLFAVVTLIGKPMERARLWFVAQAAVVLLYAGWVVYAWGTLTTYHGNAGSPSLGDAVSSALRIFAFGWDLPQHIATLFLPLFVAVAILGMAACTRLPKGWAALLLLLLWLTLPIGAIWLASRSRPIFDVRYLIEASPPLYLLLALPVAWRRQHWRPGIVAAAIGVPAVIATLIPALNSLYFHPTDGRGHAYSALGRYLASHADAADVIIVNHLDPVVRYYAQRNHVAAPLVTEPTSQNESAVALNSALSQITTGRRDVWLIPDDIGAWDTRHAVLAWSNRHLQALGQVANGFHVLEFRPWKPTEALHVDYSGLVTLTGLQLAAQAATPGHPWQVTLFWQAPRPTPVGETVSVQVLNAAGQLVAQLDGVPQNGAAPTTGWQPYETIPDPHVIQLPANMPAGRYTVGVAVYPSAGGPRLSVPGTPSGLAPVATVTVR